MPNNHDNIEQAALNTQQGGGDEVDCDCNPNGFIRMSCKKCNWQGKPVKNCVFCKGNDEWRNALGSECVCKKYVPLSRRRELAQTKVDDKDAIERVARALNSELKQRGYMALNHDRWKVLAQAAINAMPQQQAGSDKNKDNDIHALFRAFADDVVKTANTHLTVSKIQIPEEIITYWLGFLPRDLTALTELNKGLVEALKIEQSRTESCLKGFDNVKRHNYSGLELFAWIENMEEIIYGGRRNIANALAQSQPKEAGGRSGN